MNRGRSAGRRRGFAIARNERLTAMAGGILLVLILIELVVTANLHRLITAHIFVGVLLCGPLVVKMASTGYRFFRYYSGSPVFVEKGPPHWVLRLAAPFLVLLTIMVFVSGFALVAVGPRHMGLIFDVHAASVAMWIPITAVHVYAHFRKVPQLIQNDLTTQPARRVPGRLGRIAANLAALIVGLIAAILMIPVAAPWAHWRIHGEIPSPLVAGIAAGVAGIFIAIPLLRPRKGSRIVRN